MDSRQAAVLLVVLLLLTGWGHAEGPGGRGGDEIFLVSERPSPHHFFPLPQHGACALGSSTGARVFEASSFPYWPECPVFARLPAGCPCAAGGRRRTPHTTGCPGSCVTLPLPAPGHAETRPGPSLPVSAPEVWQKCPGLREQRTAEYPS